MMVDKNGIPIITLEEKLKALRECIAKDYTEDVLGHLGDLFDYYLREFNTYRHDHGLQMMTRKEAREQFMDFPTPIIGPNVLERIAKL